MLQVAVLAGDYLLARASVLLAQLNNVQVIMFRAVQVRSGLLRLDRVLCVANAVCGALDALENGGICPSGAALMSSAFQRITPVDARGGSYQNSSGPAHIPGRNLEVESPVSPPKPHVSMLSSIFSGSLEWTVRFRGQLGMSDWGRVRLIPPVIE